MSLDPETAPILVVDDRRENLLALEAALARPDYSIVLADSGSAALSKLLEGDFALILLDVSMPILDGFQTAHLIRGREKSRHIPIIFVTANMAESRQVFHGYAEGAVDYLIKPLDIQVLKMKVSVFVDLWRSARQRARDTEALAESEHRARTLSEALYDVTFEEAPIGIAHVSPEFKWRRVNARMASILRISSEELCERSLLDFVHRDDHALLLENLNRVLSGAEPRHRGDYRMVDCEGGNLWVHLTFSLIRDPEGHAVQLAIIEDVTEEKRLTRALETSERRFLRLRESGLIGIYETSDGDVIREANDAFLAMVGYTREDLARGEVLTTEIVAPESAPLDADMRERLRRSGVSPAHEKVFRRKDGRKGTMLAGAVAADGTIGFTLDITALREAALLRARSARELESSLRSRDDFLSLLAHELRNPLMPLTMQVQSLRASAASATAALDPGWVDRQLAIVERSAVRLAKLIEDLLEVSRASVGGFLLEREDMDLVELVRGVAHGSIGERGQPSVPVAISGDASVTGKWDRLALERVVAQMLSNAMKYGMGRPIEIGIKNLGDDAELTVRDHGIGIPVEHRDELFERFARFAPINHFGGMGVGLWLVRRVVAAHGGTVSASDAAGGGTCFTLRLPRMVDETRSDETEREPPPKGADSVLVVDDDDDVREIVQLGLTGAGYRVRGAANGVEALDALATEVPDLVLLDMMMPVMNGPEFLAAVRADPRYRALPVLIVTAWPAEAAALKGAHGVVAKPVDLGKLVSTINSTLH